MDLDKTNDYRRHLSIICLIGLSIGLLTDPITGVMSRGIGLSPASVAARGFSAPFMMAFVVGSMIALTQILRRTADRAGLIGAACAILGWTAGARIMVLGQLETLFSQRVGGVAPDALHSIFQAEPLVWASIVPGGILYPTGILILGIAIVVTAPISRAIGILLIAGAILFPLGRIGGFYWAIASGDLIAGTAYGLIAGHLVAKPAVWMRTEAAA